MRDRDAPAASATLATPAPSADALTVAAARAYGAIRGISNCARGGLLSPASERELNDTYRYRVEPLLQSASVLQQAANLVRRLVVVADRVRQIRNRSLD